MPIKIVYTIADRRNKTGTTSVNIQDGLDEADTDVFANAWAAALDNIIFGVIRSAVAIIDVALSGLVGNVAGGASDVEEVGEFLFYTIAGTKVEVNIPAISEGIVDNETGNIDLTDAGVAAFVTAMTDGISGIAAQPIGPTDVGGSSIATLRQARGRFRNSGSNKGVN